MKSILKIALGVILGLVVLTFFGLFALGVIFSSVEDEKTVETVEVMQEDLSVEEEESESDIEVYDEVIFDKDGFKATLVNIEKISDDFWEEEYYNINLEVVNNTDVTLEVQTREVSMDGKMVDDMVFFSETVSAGKISDVAIIIQNYDGELPALEDDLEFDMIAFDIESLDYEIEGHVFIKVK